MKEQIRAYAKINLHLDMVRKREDGYHDVMTVMQSVSLHDTVRVTLTDFPEFVCTCDVAGVPADDKNIAVRAAKLYAQRIGLSKGAFIEIEKRIPMAAGLAGGSTDAAATLVAMNNLCGKALTNDELSSLASLLGADVPFCLFGGCLYSDGRGDVLHDFLQLPEEMVVLIGCGKEGVSTPWAYSMLDFEYNDFKDYTPKKLSGLEEAIRSTDVERISKNIFNVFESTISAQRPEVNEIKSIMLQSGALNAMMSGSGPSVFGIFKSEEDAKRASEKIAREGYFACVCAPTGKRE